MNNARLAFKKYTPLIIYFHASYSGSYHLMLPVINDLKDDYKEDLNFVLIEKGMDPQMEEAYGINFYPTLLLIWENNVVVRLHGLVNREALYDHLRLLYIDIEKNKMEDDEK